MARVSRDFCVILARIPHALLVTARRGIVACPDTETRRTCVHSEYVYFEGKFLHIDQCLGERQNSRSNLMLCELTFDWKCV